MSWRCTRLGFFGRRLVGLMLDGSHHGEGEHDERDVTMPAMPGSGFVVVEPELVLGSLKAVLDRPAMALDADQGLDRSPCRTPGGEVGEIAVGDITPDQPSVWTTKSAHFSASISSTARDGQPGLKTSPLPQLRSAPIVFDIFQN